MNGIPLRFETLRVNTFPPQAMNSSDLGMAVSLSVGELPKDEYERLFLAGTRRYLLRIETSNPDLYATLHPGEMSWENRVKCLQNLKEVGQGASLWSGQSPIFAPHSLHLAFLPLKTYPCPPPPSPPSPSRLA